MPAVPPSLCLCRAALRILLSIYLNSACMQDLSFEYAGSLFAVLIHFYYIGVKPEKNRLYRRHIRSLVNRFSAGLCSAWFGLLLGRCAAGNGFKYDLDFPADRPAQNILNHFRPAVAPTETGGK